MHWREEIEEPRIYIVYTEAHYVRPCFVTYRAKNTLICFFLAVYKETWLLMVSVISNTSPSACIIRRSAYWHMYVTRAFMQEVYDRCTRQCFHGTWPADESRLQSTARCSHRTRERARALQHMGKARPSFGSTEQKSQISLMPNSAQLIISFVSRGLP